MKLVGKIEKQSKFADEWLGIAAISGLFLAGAWLFAPQNFWLAVYMQVMIIVFKFLITKFFPTRRTLSPFSFQHGNLRFTSRGNFTEKSINYGTEEVKPHNGVFFYLKFQVVNEGQEPVSLPNNVAIRNLVEKYSILEWLVIEDQNPVYTLPSENALVNMAVDFLNDGKPKPTPDFSNRLNPGSSKIVQARFDVPPQVMKLGSGYVISFDDVTVYRF